MHCGSAHHLISRILSFVSLVDVSTKAILWNTVSNDTEDNISGLKGWLASRRIENLLHNQNSYMYVQ
jgi:hypothetical protein